MQIITTRKCKHYSHKYRVTYETGLENRPQSTYILCQDCYEKPHFSNIENIISREVIN